MLQKTVSNNKSAIFLLAKIKADLGKLTEAEELCSKGLVIDKLDPALHYFHATVMQELGKDELAISSLKRAIYLENDYVLAHFLLGTLSLKTGDRAGGLKSFANAVSSLSKFSPEDILPETDGLTALKFMELINSIKN